jgi:hypothetical protein
MTTHRTQQPLRAATWLVATILLVIIAACSDNDSTSTGERVDSGGGSDGSRAPRDSGSGVEGEGLSCFIKTTLQNNCWACHGSRPTNGAPYSLINREEFLMVADQGQTRLQRAIERMRSTTKPMPPNGRNAVPDAEIKTFEDWGKAGTPTEQCAAGDAGACKTCTDMVNDYAACVSPSGAPNLCDNQKGPSFFICASQQCNKECGLATSPGGTPETPCDPANGAACRTCLETKCKTDLEACK